MEDCGTHGMQAARFVPWYSFLSSWGETGALNPVPPPLFPVRECGVQFIAGCYFSIVNFGGVLFLETGAVCALAVIAIVAIGVAVIMVGILAFIAVGVFSIIAVIETAGSTRQQGSNQAGL
ncbi:hypothetical protein DSO57_1018142 [Entomophthora muscae]|uniref:Uncharacterized protein n=1 Tax=Entomophthora muscae TaxID=34485 RepID=A0ACC2U2Z0_9FUNG|nr:hypothetical protein DSO57_1018142 [Entomophthora muscae]